VLRYTLFNVLKVSLILVSFQPQNLSGLRDNGGAHGSKKFISRFTPMASKYTPKEIQLLFYCD